jgi:alginate O-acetyltransferase complex protein AlgJ
MRQRKLVYTFVILSILFVLSLPILNLSFAYIYKNKKITLQSFSKQQLFSTDNLESITNYLFYKAFNISMNEGHVIAGKDDFLFLGKGHAGIIEKTKGTFPYQLQEIDVWTAKLKELQDWYEEMGIEFILIVAPNKHTVYSDKLPDDIPYREGKTITDDIVNYAHKKDIHILNLKNTLREEKEEKQLYFHTDTHWNTYGAHIGYINSIHHLNLTYGKNYTLVGYTMKESTPTGDGDLSKLLKISNFLSNDHEKEYELIFNNESDLCYGKITAKNTLETCTSGDKNMFNQYIINTTAPNKEKLLYLSDSFGVANSQLYFETFGTVWRFHLQYMHGKALIDFIKEHKPDVIIYQVVERDLYNPYIIEGVPQILK